MRIDKNCMEGMNCRLIQMFNDERSARFRNSPRQRRIPMKTHLDDSKGSELAMAAVKADAVSAHMPASGRNDEASVLHAVAADGISIACYENRIPAFVEAALEQRYGSLFSSLAAMRAYGDLANTSTFLATRNGEVFMLWLFQRRGKWVRVMNESIVVTEAEAACFADYIFAAFPQAQFITFNAVDADIRRFAWPLQREDCTDDSVLALPASMDEYLASLGKATRKNIKRYTARLKEEFPSFACSVSLQEKIDEQTVRAIIELNRRRMDRKGKPQGITLDDERVILEIARHHGMLFTATIDGKVCAGAILFRLRDNYFSFVRAHDPAYDPYRLGLVGACAMIAECIARGGRELHFMWGREQHKALLLGVEKRLERLVLYRSRWHVLLNLQIASKTMFFGASRRCRLWLQDKINRDDDLVARTAGGVRRLVRLLRGRHA